MAALRRAQENGGVLSGGVRHTTNHGDGFHIPVQNETCWRRPRSHKLEHDRGVEDIKLNIRACRLKLLARGAGTQQEFPITKMFFLWARE